MIYRRRPTPLHAARAGAAAGYCLALALVALVLDNPLVLAADIAALLVAGTLAGCGRAMRRALLLAVPLAILIVLINALVTRDGLTVIARLGHLPVLGQIDVTLEATVYGGVLALRAVALILCGTLYTVAVDPDEVLQLFRRTSFRSALTATLATRLVPVLLRDSRRLADAQRCRPGPPPSRLLLMRAASANVLDRALDAAAALEVRGYGAARRPAGGSRRRVGVRARSRHDLAFGAAAVAIAVLAIVARATGLAPLHAYPDLRVGANPAALAVALVTLIIAVLPFADRRGIG